ncbi:neuropeptide B [Gavia stellata]|uniref:neuropeptide B n=1 Tax=Gavia stellata TaxID=37040 RepID=UPI0028A098D6|nr:neuropeptide B [Gavia stellata]
MPFRARDRRSGGAGGSAAGRAAAPERCGPAGTIRAARWLGLGLLLLCLCRPAEPWYKQAAGPRRYSVGRASGLLSGLRRSPHTRRSDTDGTTEPSPGVLLPGTARAPVQLHATALCVMDVAPELRSCQVLPGVPSALQCKAVATVSLDPMECVDA